MDIETLFSTVLGTYHIESIDASQYSVEGNSVRISTSGFASKDFYIHRDSLETLRTGGPLPPINKLFFVASSGYIFRDFCEVYVVLPGDEEWPYSETDRLRFKIRNVNFELSKPTSVSEFIVRTQYFVHVTDLDLTAMKSLKVFPVGNRADVSRWIHKGFFYLNAHYLYASKTHVLPKHFEPKYPDVYAVSNDMIARQRVRKRKDLTSIEPVQLYNFALTQEGEYRFLAFYRVLEFFFPRVVEMRVRVMRQDAAYTDREIVEYISGTAKNEQKYLLQVLEQSLTTGRRENILKFATATGLSAKPDLASLTDSLYAYRNSVTHAKESELDKTTIPDLFPVASLSRHWNSLVRDLAKNAIIKLNSN